MVVCTNGCSVSTTSSLVTGFSGPAASTTSFIDTIPNSVLPKPTTGSRRTLACFMVVSTVHTSSSGVQVTTVLVATAPTLR